MKLLIDVHRKAKELEKTRVYNHCAQHRERILRSQNVVLLFIETDEYTLEGLWENALRYLSRNLSTIRTDSETKDSLVETVEKPILMTEVMKADV